MLTLPLSVSKYAATGTGSAVARIAKFDPRLRQVAGESGAAGQAVKSTTTGYQPNNGINFPKYYFKNFGETAVNVKIVPIYVKDPYTIGSLLHDTGNGKFVGAYYGGANKRTEIPEAGIAVTVPTGAATTAARSQLAYELWSLPVAQGSRDIKNPTQAASAVGKLASNGVDVAPYNFVASAALPTNDAVLAPFYQLYTGTTVANGALDRTNVTGSTTYDMNGCWRTYRVNYDVVVTQID